MKDDLSKADSLFSKKIISWYEINGRTSLPWRKNITPYRVWISEIMLQQTCLLYTSPSPRDGLLSRMPSSA